MAHVLFLHSIRHTMKENKAKHADGFYKAKQRFVQQATHTHTYTDWSQKKWKSYLKCTHKLISHIVNIDKSEYELLAQWLCSSHDQPNGCLNTQKARQAQWHKHNPLKVSERELLQRCTLIWWLEIGNRKLQNQNNWIELVIGVCFVWCFACVYWERCTKSVRAFSESI